MATVSGPSAVREAAAAKNESDMKKVVHADDDRGGPCDFRVGARTISKAAVTSGPTTDNKGLDTHVPH